MTRRIIATLALFFSASHAAAQKSEPWVEVRSPNFTVVTTHNEKQARAVAEQFELFRAVAQRIMPKANFDLGRPLLILAVKNEKGLKELLPAYWEKKGSVHPAGYFISGEEKLYVALRTDIQGDYPYQIIYHEYVHALLRKNFESIPLWLNEGFAELLGHSVIGSREAGIGRPSESHILWLQSNKLLPLDVLLTVDHKSPHYNESNRASVFYAQAWALTHYLMLSDKGRAENLLEKYFKEIDKGVSEKLAAAAAFGDMKKFERTIEAYLRQSSFKYFSIKQPPEIDEKTFPVRTLSVAESAAVRGDFHVYTQRPKEARALLQEALRLEPANALAHESLGLLALRERNQESASQFFAKAAALNSKSYLAHYYAAVLNQEGGFGGRSEQTESSLRKALELNPSFAPACSMLGTLYAADDDKLEEALKYSRRAVQLEPGFFGYRINLASVLMRMKRVDEAIQIAERVAAAATDDGQRMMASRFLQSAQEYKESLLRFEAAKKDAEERSARREAEAAEYEARMAKRREEAKRETSVQLKPGEIAAYGTITQVSCTGADVLQLRLLMGGETLHLRAAKRMAIPYSIGAGRLRQIDPCKDLHRQQAQVVYRAGKTRAQPADLVAIEMLNDPVEVGPTPAAPPAPSKRVATSAAAAASTTAASDAPPASGRPGWSEGKIGLVSCTGAEMRVTVEIGGGFFTKLRAANYHKVEFLAAAGASVPDSFQPCSELRGRNAGVKYFAVDGKPYEGEIASIEIRP